MSQPSWPNQQQPPAPPSPPPYPPTGYQTPPAAQPVIPWYHQKWFVVLMCLFFWPVGIALLWRSPLTKPQGRVVWTVIASLMFIALIRRSPVPPAAPAPITSTPTAAQQAAPASTPVSQTPTPAPAPATKAAPTWQAVKSWKGSGMKETESFDIANREWRINWKASNEQTAGILAIMVHDQNGGLVSMAANAQGEGSDTSYVRGKPGKYYLAITSANIDWEITVEEQR
jgi:hypothetical protein